MQNLFLFCFWPEILGFVRRVFCRFLLSLHAGWRCSRTVVISLPLVTTLPTLPHWSFVEFITIFPNHAQMLLTQSSTDAARPSCHTETLWGGIRKGGWLVGRGLYFPGGGFRLLWGLSPRGLWLCHTAISHCNARIQRERERVVTEAKQQTKTAIQAEREMERERKRASFVPNSFLWDTISVLYLSL